MATVVLHKPTGKKYILLGTGYGAYKSSRASYLGGNLFPHEEEGTTEAAAVCDNNGNIDWFLTEELKVLEIEGRKVNDLFKELIGETKVDKDKAAEVQKDNCPACGAEVSLVTDVDKYCPSCGIAFIDEEEQ